MSLSYQEKRDSIARVPQRIYNMMLEEADGDNLILSSLIRTFSVIKSASQEKESDLWKIPQD